LRSILQGLTSAILRYKAKTEINPQNDPDKKYEVDLWLKIIERSYDFMCDYKRRYYDQLQTEAEKKKVRVTLVSMIGSDHYSISRKTLIAYVCADIGIVDSLEEIKRLGVDPACSDVERFAFKLACEKLSQACG